MITVTINAETVEQLAPIWDHLKAATKRAADIDIVGAEMFIEIDLSAREQLALVEPLPAETVEVAETTVPDTDAPDVEDGNDDQPEPATDSEPADQLHLRRHILTLLATSKQPAKDLAAELDVDVAVVKEVLASLSADGLVRRAGVAGWALVEEQDSPIKRTPVDADAARRRAAEAM